nr:hypothetical protein [Nocardiopsis potens]
MAGLLLRVVAVGAALAAGGAASAPPAQGGPPASAAHAQASDAVAAGGGPPGGPAVLVGVPGLRWEEVGPGTMPVLWELAGGSAIGNMSIRTATSRTCPVDGWLTVSAGQRAFSLRQQYSICELPVPPERSDGGAVVPDFDDHVEVNAGSPYGAEVGLLGRSVHEMGGTTLAVGPGAALAAADEDGRVDDYLSGTEALRREDMESAWLTVVAVDPLADLYLNPPEDPEATPDEKESTANSEEEPEPEPGPVQERQRREALADADAELGRVLDELPEGATLMVAGVSVEAGASRLNAALLHGPGPEAAGYGGGHLRSESTRRDGLVTLTDATMTLVRSMGTEPTRAMVGRTWSAVERPEGTERSVGDLTAFATAADVVQALMAGFFSLLVAIQLLIYAAAAYAVHRYGERNRTKRAQVLAVTRLVALGGAAVPVSSYLANLVPWWSSSVPQVALPVCVLACAALVVLAAVAGPWRRTVLGPMTVVAGITTAVLFVDMCTGSNLQMNSPTGYTPIVAGRFYGLGNIAFATFATGMLMLVAGVAHFLIERGRRRAAVAAAAAIGLATMVVIGTPGLGTDFGGLIAILPGLAVTVLMIAGRRVTVGRMALVCAAGAVLLAAVSYWDYLGPPAERSHFGLFAEQVLRGEAGPVVARKLGAMLGTLGNWQLTLLAACALLFLFAVLNKPTNWRMGALQRTYEYAPTLRAGLTGSLVTALVGFAANDSGIAIPALALTVAVPLTLSAAVWVMQREGPQADGAAEPEGPAGPDGARDGVPSGGGETVGR